VSNIFIIIVSCFSEQLFSEESKIIREFPHPHGNEMTNEYMKCSHCICLRFNAITKFITERYITQVMRMITEIQVTITYWLVLPSML